MCSKHVCFTSHLDKILAYLPPQLTANYLPIYKVLHPWSTTHQGKVGYRVQILLLGGAQRGIQGSLFTQIQESELAQLCRRRKRSLSRGLINIGNTSGRGDLDILSLETESWVKGILPIIIPYFLVIVGIRKTILLQNSTKMLNSEVQLERLGSVWVKTICMWTSLVPNLSQQKV